MYLIKDEEEEEEVRKYTGIQHKNEEKAKRTSNKYANKVNKENTFFRNPYKCIFIVHCECEWKWEPKKTACKSM